VRVVLLAVLVAVAVPVVGRPAAGTLQQTVPAPDFDGDGFGDLAVGAPGETVGGARDAGAASALLGAAGGLGAGGRQLLSQGAGGLGGAAEAGDLAGAAFS
jgi:hypothetical protein